MLSGLPQIVDLYRLAVAGEAYAGRVKQSVFKRICSVANDGGQWVDVSLQFGVKQRVHYLHGGLKAEFTLVCQRCMDPMRLPVEASFLLGFVRNKAQEAQLPEEFEPLWVEQTEMDLLSVIEDELLLALPMAPLHPRAECPAWVAPVVMNERADSDRKTPFSVLAGLNKREKH